MKVGIIGGGSIGLLFGAYLGDSHSVTIFTRRKSQQELLQKEGILLHTPEGAMRTVNVDARAGLDGLQHMDFVIVAVKQYHLDGVKNKLLTFSPELPVCFIQNGMGHMDLLQSLPNKIIFVGTVEHGAKRVDDRTVIHNGVGKTKLSLFKGEKADEAKFPVTEEPLFPVSFHPDYKEILISKLVANALINPLTALFQVKNGRLIDNPYLFEIFKLLFEEIYEIFPLGTKERALQSAIGICKATKENTSSMLKDIQEGRQTEIDAILGYVLKVAEQKGKRLKTARMVYVMIKGIEEERG